MNIPSKLAGVALVAAIAIGGAYAQSPQGQGRPATTQTPAAETPATMAFKAANMRMHETMNITFTANADVDFVRLMIQHHQGAIDMAKVLLERGRDEQTRKWATDIIRDQQRDMNEMKAWLQRHGG